MLEYDIPKDLNSIGNNWKKYEGEFKNGFFDGDGIWIFGNGSKIHGHFTLGLLSGVATFINKNKQEIKTEWHQNTLFKEL